MRLLSTDTQFGLTVKYFEDPNCCPQYGVISHVWGKDELLYVDIVNSDYDRTWDNYKKVVACCEAARRRRLQYVWINTCCIDWRSDLEVREAVNSRFAWYKKAVLCFAFLEDVPSSNNPSAKNSAFRTSRWFTTDWTLQDLIAPEIVLFFTKGGELIGSKSDLASTISEVTGVDYGVLNGLTPIEAMSTAKKMSWAVGRKAIKSEERAYSLLGLFGVNMTTIYGEGEKAFDRLQHEIIVHSADHSIFAFDTRETGSTSSFRGLLASTPDEFSASANVVRTPYSLFRNTWGIQSPAPYIQKTASGLVIEVPVIDDPTSETGNDEWIYIGLACKNLTSNAPSQTLSTVGLLLMRARGSEDLYVRAADRGLFNFDHIAAVHGRWDVRRIHIAGVYKQPSDHDLMAMISRELSPPLFRITIMANTIRTLRDVLGCNIMEGLCFFVARFPKVCGRRPLELKRQKSAQQGREEATTDCDLLIEVPHGAIPVLVLVPSSDRSPARARDISPFAIAISIHDPSSLAFQIYLDISANLRPSRLAEWHKTDLGKYQQQGWGSDGVAWTSFTLIPGLSLDLELTRTSISQAASYALLDINVKGEQDLCACHRRDLTKIRTRYTCVRGGFADH